MQVGALVSRAYRGNAILRRSVLTAIAAAMAQIAVAQTFTVIDAPNADATYAICINANGVVAGYYRSDNLPQTHGYVRAADGSFTEFDPPNSDQTSVTGINKSGMIVGNYNDSISRLNLGYLRQTSGDFVILQPSTTATSVNVSGINDNGEVVGWYYANNAVVGFSWTAKNGYTKFLGPSNGPIEPFGVNASGEMAGLWLRRSSPPINFGFVRSTTGVITTFSVPHADTTIATAINIHGAVTGYYQDSGSGSVSFLRSATGSIVGFNGPGGTPLAPSAINDNGAIVGEYVDESTGNTTRPFLRSASGVMSEIELPVSYIYATATGINNAGHIAGYDEDESRVWHGWLQ